MPRLLHYLCLHHIYRNLQTRTAARYRKPKTTNIRTHLANAFVVPQLRRLSLPHTFRQTWRLDHPFPDHDTGFRCPRPKWEEAADNQVACWAEQDNNGGKNKEASLTTSQSQQSGGIQIDFYTMGSIRSERKFKVTVLLHNGASNHIFNCWDRFIEYTPCMNHDPILAGTILEDDESAGGARITVTTHRDKMDITFRNALHVPS